MTPNKIWQANKAFPLDNKARPASDGAVTQYLLWLRERRGLPALDLTETEWRTYPGSRERLCIGGTFGERTQERRQISPPRWEEGTYYPGEYQPELWEEGAFSIIMPGHDAHKQRVTFETLDESGEVLRSQTLPREPKKGGVIWSRDEVRVAAGPMPKAAKPRKAKAAPPPIAEPAPAAPIVEIAAPVAPIGNPITLAHRTTRAEWRKAYGTARKDKLAGKALYDMLSRDLSRNTAIMLHGAIERAREPAWPSREARQKSVLNCFGTKNPYSAPAMDSPRFEAWRRIVARVDALVKRLEAAGRIERDDGGFVARVLPLPETARQSLTERASGPAAATTPAPEPENALCEAPAANLGQSEPGGEVANPVLADLAARIAAIEARLATPVSVESEAPPVVDMRDDPTWRPASNGAGKFRFGAARFGGREWAEREDGATIRVASYEAACALAESLNAPPIAQPAGKFAVDCIAQRRKVNGYGMNGDARAFGYLDGCSGKPVDESIAGEAAFSTPYMGGYRDGVAAREAAERPRRTPAHERAVRRAWAERKARRQAQALEAIEREKSAAYFDMWRAAVIAGDKLKQRRRRSTILARQRGTEMGKLAAMVRDEAQQTTFQRQRADVLHAQLARLKADMADPAQPERASDITRLTRERDQARTALAAVNQRNQQMQAATDAMAEQFEALCSRVAVAEAKLRREVA